MLFVQILTSNVQLRPSGSVLRQASSFPYIYVLALLSLYFCFPSSSLSATFLICNGIRYLTLRALLLLPLSTGLIIFCVATVPYFLFHHIYVHAILPPPIDFSLLFPCATDLRSGILAFFFFISILALPFLSHFWI